MRSDQSATSRSRSPGLTPAVSGMLKTTATATTSTPPVTITEPPPKTLASTKAPPSTSNGSSRAAATASRKPPLAMHKSTNNLRTSSNGNNSGNNNSSSSPAGGIITPRLPGYRVAAASSSSSLSPGLQSNSQPHISSSSSTVSSSPRHVRPSTARRPGDTSGPGYAATESSAAPRRSSYVGPQARPLSSMSSTSTLSPGPPLRAARPGIGINANANANTSTDRPNSPSTSKFFHASDLKPSRKTTPGQQFQPPKLYAANGGDTSSHNINNGNNTVATPQVTAAAATHLTPRLPSQNTRPSSPVGSPQSQSQLAYPGSTRGVKFVYANGTEEVLEPRGKATSTSDGSSRPPSPNPNSSSKFHTPPGSSVGTLSPSQPVHSPTTPRPPLSLGRKSSVSSTTGNARHGRAQSIGANGLPQEIFLVPEALRSPIGTPKAPTGGNEGHEAPYMAPQALTLKMREELAANARQERKIMDLEISNNSLSAINRTIERKMRKQNSELRRYRRLARSGQLQPKATATKKRRSSKASGDGDEVYITNEVSGDEHEVEGDRDGGDEDEEDDSDDEEDEDDDSEDDDEDSQSSSADDGQQQNGPHQNVTLRRRRTGMARTDKDKVTAELSKHQALLEASAKTNASLKRCTFMIEEMMKEANKALSYKVKAEEVKIGGRVLGSDEEDEDGEGDGEEEVQTGEVRPRRRRRAKEKGEVDDDEEESEESDEEDDDAGDGDVTETEAEDMTGTEAEEETDDDHSRRGGVDTDTEDEGMSSQID